jgi:hypothetical protein
MYKVAIISGNISNIGHILKQTIDDINASWGTIHHMVQSQSSSAAGTIITITIVYRAGG